MARKRAEEEERLSRARRLEARQQREEERRMRQEDARVQRRKERESKEAQREKYSLLFTDEIRTQSCIEDWNQSKKAAFLIPPMQTPVVSSDRQLCLFGN